MANVKRSVLGSIAEMVLYVRSSAKGFEVFGLDKVGRKVVFSRRMELEKSLLDAEATAQLLADYRNKPVRLDLEEGTGESLPEDR